MKHLTNRFLASLLCVQVALVFPVAAAEVVLRPDGLNSDAGWALNRVGEEFSAGSTSAYAYPETATPVRLYLIDTKVADLGSFKTANPKVLSCESRSFRGANDPPEITAQAHGTQLLSLIVGKETGVAPGTPIHVVNYDIYPSDTTTITLLTEAINEAVRDHRDKNWEGPPMRSVICVATSSAELVGSSTAQVSALENRIDFALSEGIPVVLSAGNLGVDASGIVPSSQGIKNGVICVGATYASDFKVADSNFGAPVDIFAPGFDVPTRAESATSPIILMDGTSPAAALVTGAVLAKLSASPTHTPAGIESSLKAAAEVSSASGLRLLRSVVPPDSSFVPPDVVPDGPVTPAASSVPLTWDPPVVAAGSFAIPPPASGEEVVPPPAPDADSDGIPNMVEDFHGDKNIPQGPEISLSADQKIQFKFSINSDLLDGTDPFVLRNGYTWRIRCSTGLTNWVVPEGELVKSTANGRTYLTASFPAGGPSCFARIEIVAP